MKTSNRKTSIKGSKKNKANKSFHPNDPIYIAITKNSVSRSEVILEIQYSMVTPGNVTFGSFSHRITVIGRWTNIILPFPVNTNDTLLVSSIAFNVINFQNGDRHPVPHNNNRTRVFYETGRQGHVTIREDRLRTLDKPGILAQRAIYTITME